MGENSELGMFVRRKQGLLLSVHVDDINMAREKQNMAPMWKKWMKSVDLVEPTSFLDHVYLGHALSVNANRMKQSLNKFSKMFESRISTGATEKLPRRQKPHAKTVAWSYDMEGHARKCVERYCELAKQESGASVQSFKSLPG